MRTPIVLTVLTAVWMLATTATAEEFPGQEWEQATPAQLGLDAELLQQARDYALTGGGSGFITRQGKLVLAWGDLTQQYDLKSTSKSIGITALGLAIADGKLSLADPAGRHHPSLGVPPEANAATGWLDEITIQHLATQTAGFEKPGGYEPLLFRPGTQWHYSDGGPNWLAECVTLAYRRDVQDLLFERVFTPIGITPEDLRWRNHAYRPQQLDGIPRREFGSGVHANVDAMARIGLLYLRQGRWQDQQLLPAEFVQQAGSTLPQVVGLPEHIENHGNASDHYGLLWWNNADGTLPNVPRSAYWSWGLYDSLILVIPELEIVVARAGRSWDRKEWNGHYDVLAPFFDPIVAAADSVVVDNSDQSATDDAPPYPRSQFITDVKWGEPDSIVRLAHGSDNWPITWADDDLLYTAYGDGRGFQPFVDRKLSLGLAKVAGLPPAVQGSNLRAETAEALGDGPGGRKASGLLMVDGTLYLWVRNADNSQLGWSADQGRTWTWADWKFEHSYGSPTFLNFGRNYAGARDQFVYTYSADSESAYTPADRFVLARVPQDRIKDRAAWQFFTGLDSEQQPGWSDDLQQQAAVFRHPGRCYRSGITWNAGLQRYLWCQTLPDSTDSRGPRFQGGFGIYESAQPWGPWSTVYYTTDWDVGPGETSSLPTRWMSSDGTTAWLLFSGDDAFSVRQLRFVTGERK